MKKYADISLDGVSIALARGRKSSGKTPIMIGANPIPHNWPYRIMEVDLSM
jgi:hypothetical protein